MAEKRDYYEILGVAKGASAADIKQAYRKLALAWHPDRNKAADAATKFKEINEAYAVLSDEKKRGMYDQFGHAGIAGGGAGAAGGAGNPFGGGFRQQGPFNYYYSSSGGANPFGADSFDPFEIFEQFFGGGFSTRPSQRRPVYEIAIDFHDAVKGVTREISVPKGSAGEGSVKKTIRIPPGIDSGQRVRFETFDIQVDVRSDPRYKRQGDDLIVDESITIPQAVLGDVIEVPTVDGPVKIRVSAGTESGTLVRLRGKGMPHVRGGGRGEQYVRLTVHIPTKVSRRAKELLGELKREL